MIPRRHMMKLYEQSNAFVPGERAHAQSNLPQENALSKPAAGINYESKATAVPPAIPVRSQEGLRGWLDRSHGEATDVARTFS